MGSDSLPMTGLKRQSSVTSEPGWERDLSVLMCDCIDPDSFIAVVRASSGASADLTGSFLDRYVFDSGALFLRMGISVEPIKVSDFAIFLCCFSMNRVVAVSS